MFKLLDTVVLDRDIPRNGLRRGDLGAIVEVVADDAFEVEFVAASGRTQALVTLRLGDIRPVDDRDIVSVQTDSPVMLPPGRVRLATCPRPTGSAWLANTMGRVLVACRAASVSVEAGAKVTSTFIRIAP